jgi:hypothetical protein
MCQRRVLLARIKGEVRQVQFCKWKTTIEGSLEPLCRLTHSILEARRRVTMRSRSLVSASNRALPSCADAKGEGDTHVERCIGLQVCKLQRCCHNMLCFEVGDGFDELVQVHVASAEIPVRPAFPRPVAHLLCNRQALRVVLDGLAEVPLRLIRVAKVPVRPALPRPVAHLLGNLQVLRVVLDRLGKVPQRLVRVPQVPVRAALPRPVAHLLCNRQVLRVVLDGLVKVPLRLIRDAQIRVRPAPFAIARCLPWYSIAFA